jgi:ABC-type multidrug transport system ATPase subunit
MAIIDKGKLLFAGSPDDAISGLRGKIWELSVEKSQLDDLRSKFKVISSKLVAGKPLIHIYNESSPQDGFRAAEADLEDVFFTRIAGLA